MASSMQYEYKELEGYVYHTASEPTQYLRKWLEREWVNDVKESPDQSWTPGWIEDLRRFEFKLEIIEIEKVRPHSELMTYAKGNYSFQGELLERVAERLEAVKMGTSIMPLVIRGTDTELMDGYTRYMTLKQLGAKKVYAYIGYPVE